MERDRRSSMSAILSVRTPFVTTPRGDRRNVDLMRFLILFNFPSFENVQSGDETHHQSVERTRDESHRRAPTGDWTMLRAWPAHLKALVFPALTDSEIINRARKGRGGCFNPGRVYMTSRCVYGTIPVLRATYSMTNG